MIPPIEHRDEVSELLSWEESEHREVRWVQTKGSGVKFQGVETNYTNKRVPPWKFLTNQHGPLISIHHNVH